MSKIKLLLLLLIFGISFWLTGGNNLFNDYHNSASVNNKAIDDSLITAGSFYDKVKRLIFLPEAVDIALNEKNIINYTKLKNINLTMQQAVIAVEDNRFNRHLGIDIESIIRATLVNLQHGQVEEGASTITQQLVKNLFFNNDRTVNRKVEEIILSLVLEQRYTKDEILEFYLNSIYFGAGFYGIADASQGYFGKAPYELNIAESAMLAGIPNAPSVYSPYVNFGAAKTRQAIVLNAMFKNGYIGEQASQDAKLEILNFIK